MDYIACNLSFPDDIYHHHHRDIHVSVVEARKTSGGYEIYLEWPHSIDTPTRHVD